jgi:hypothetical protein
MPDIEVQITTLCRIALKKTPRRTRRRRRDPHSHRATQIRPALRQTAPTGRGEAMTKQNDDRGTWHTTSKGERFFIPATGWQRRLFNGLAGAHPKR